MTICTYSESTKKKMRGIITKVMTASILLMRRKLFQISLPMRVRIDLRPTIERRPLGLVLEQPQRMNIIALIRRKPVINPRRQDDQIILLDLDPHPVILLTADVKVTGPIEYVANLLILMQMLGEEGLDFLLVDIAHRFRGHDNLVAVLVFALPRQLIDGFDRRAVAVEQAETAEMGHVDGAARVVGEALIALILLASSM